MSISNFTWEKEVLSRTQMGVLFALTTPALKAGQAKSVVAALFYSGLKLTRINKLYI